MKNHAPAGSVSTPAAVRARVLHVVDRQAYGCLGRMVRQTLLALNDVDIGVGLLTDSPRLASQLEGTGVRSTLLPGFDLLSRWRWRAEAREEPAEPPEIVHLWSARQLPWIGSWARSAGAKLVIHCLAATDVERLCRGGFDERYETFIAGCEPYRRRLAERWPSVADRFNCIPPALLAPDADGATRRSDGTLGVMWCDRGEDLAGLTVLCDALAQLHRKQIDVQAVLVGGPDRGAALWRIVRSHGVDSCVSMVEEPTIWDRALPGIDVYVAPAPESSLSLAPLLAMATGRLVVASRELSAEWFVEDETCLMITPGSAAELAYHLMNAAAGHPALSVLASSARDYIRRRHSVTDAAGALGAIYDRIRAPEVEPAALHEAGA